MIPRILFRSISLIAILGFSSALCAQPTKTPTLNEILDRLQANLNHYHTSLPSLFCDEHVSSSQYVGIFDPDWYNQTTVTDSIFRLKRTPNADHTTSLIESREIKSINYKPATSQTIDLPFSVSGVFVGGFAVVTPSQQACMKYELQPVNKKSLTGPYIIRFSTALTPQNTTACVLQEETSGRVFIDPRSMQIKRMELTTPHHTVPGKPGFSKVVINADYEPVLLGRETFWLPSEVTSNSINDVIIEGRPVETTWSFRATYRNYHKLEVTSRILKGYEVLAP